jgi:hypothetical protein
MNGVRRLFLFAFLLFSATSLFYFMEPRYAELYQLVRENLLKKETFWFAVAGYVTLLSIFGTTVYALCDYLVFGKEEEEE